jgi:putative flippase GtrA
MMNAMMLRFLFFGALLVGTSYVLFSLLVFMGVNPYVAIVSGSLIFTVIRYYVYKKLVFEQTRDDKQGAVRFIIVTIALVLSNNLMFFVAHEILAVNEYLAQLVVVGALALVSFVVQRKFVF